MESSPIGDGELVSQEGWILRADRDLFQTIGQLINDFDRNLAIELEPRLKDPFLRLLRPDVLQKVLAPVFERCPTCRVQRYYMSYRRNDRLYGSRILKAQRYHLTPSGNEQFGLKDRTQRSLTDGKWVLR